ncbi:MAG: DUF4382 domain-containing protein [Candidatus Nanohaloarchaea archaeon]
MEIETGYLVAGAAVVLVLLFFLFNPSGTPDGEGVSMGEFSLLISDRPSAIGQFGKLDVSFSRMRIHSAGNGTNSSRGFTVVGFNGTPTVDLTRVQGDNATAILEDYPLEPGNYSKIELYVANVDGTVDGHQVDVKVPSQKLQITKPFTVAPNETVEFVFDITVVEKGTGGYNLIPVISESGPREGSGAPAEAGGPPENTGQPAQ